EPIGDLYKTQVVELAKHLQIHEEILKSEPTAGLWKGQTDLGEIGIDYGKLDTILETMDSRLKPERIDPRIMGKVKKMIRKSEHKRRTPEICELS
ncbi:MAG: NAD(+) synthase, partial [Candidatus Aenigmarchaeota archaeon]|nr:NAD(+) synthase [Candidatus Aenigmarchaeota archaeon]